MGVITLDIRGLNQAVRAMCHEVQSTSKKPLDWHSLTEEELLYEMAVCVFSSQLLFEVAVAMADRLKIKGLLQVKDSCFDPEAYEASVVYALSHPVEVLSDGKVRSTMPRFRNRLASLLASTLAEIHGQGQSLRGLLSGAHNTTRARSVLVEKVWGFGPKQASLFLRRIGYDANLAVLDIHIMDFLRFTRGIHATPSALGRLSSYEQIEAAFKDVATEFGHTVGCLDLATWITMRVAKREAMLCV